MINAFAQPFRLQQRILRDKIDSDIEPGTVGNDVLHGSVGSFRKSLVDKVLKGKHVCLSVSSL